MATSRSFSDDGDTVIAFNGEIYNHLEIRAELEALGHRFRSRCDTETVLHAFLQWDMACFSRLRGMFAVALWTESRKRLVLARDRMGIKPLYYYRGGDDVYFGSELKAILEHPEMPRRLDLQALDAYLSVNYVPGPDTLIEGIRKLPPGHLLEWQHGRVWIEPWWKPVVGQNPTVDRWGMRKRNWIACCGNRSASTWCRTCRWGCGRRAAWIPRPSCTMRRNAVRAAEDLFGVVRRGGASTRARTSGRSRKCTAPTTTSST